MMVETLLEFATDRMLTILLVKERAKCRRRNRGEKHHLLNKRCDISELTNRKMLSRMMPPRNDWVRPSKRKKLDNNAVDTSKNAEKALLLTIKRDRELQKKEGKPFPYLDELDAFFTKIRERLSSDGLIFEAPHLKPILKEQKRMDDGNKKVTCRPLTVYSKFEDKIILALTCRYLTRYVDKLLHENLLSYRHRRSFHGKRHHITDFNDGIELIKEFRETHKDSTIYAADCDIKKFYDIIPHQVVRDCFEDVLKQLELNDEGKKQVMNVVEAYLNSYDFYTNVWQESQQNKAIFSKIQRRLHDKDGNNTYRIEWVEELWKKPSEQRRHIGVSQGGSLSLLIANIVLNHVDKVITDTEDSERLFIRYCDDMIMLHTDYDECCRLMDLYAQSLTRHGLYYHQFNSVSDCSRSQFWKVKSHHPFLWEDGVGNCNRYIGFLGYEIRRDGRIRLRKSNIERFEEKFRRNKYALRRYKKEHTDEEFRIHQNKVLETILKGVNFYKSLDMPKFLRGSQYRHLEKLRKRTEQT